MLNQFMASAKANDSSYTDLKSEQLLLLVFNSQSMVSIFLSIIYITITEKC